jgi:hypothetical protein
VNQTLQKNFDEGARRDLVIYSVGASQTSPSG